MKFKHLLIALTFFNLSAIAQNVGIGTATPNASAQLEVSSTNSGFLPPRMSFAQRNAISNPSQGLIIYCTDCGTKGQAQIFDGTDWTDLTGGLARPKVFVDTFNDAVVIGNQIWDTKNLSVSRYRNGDVIPQVTNPTQWGQLTTGAWCWYNNDSAANASTYGRLYNWYAVNDTRGLAPQGWHVASDNDWNKLVKYLDEVADTNCVYCYQSANAGGAMKSTRVWNAPNIGATNTIGFTAFSGGSRLNNGSFFYIGQYGYWWTSTILDNNLAYCRQMNYSSSNVSREFESKTHGFSVRCIKN